MNRTLGENINSRRCCWEKKKNDTDLTTSQNWKKKTYLHDSSYHGQIWFLLSLSKYTLFPSWFTHKIVFTFQHFVLLSTFILYYYYYILCLYTYCAVLHNGFCHNDTNEFCGHCSTAVCGQAHILLATVASSCSDSGFLLRS